MDFVFVDVDKCETCNLDITDMVLGDIGLFMSWILSGPNIDHIYRAGSLLDRPLNFDRVNFPESIKEGLGFDRMTEVMEKRENDHSSNNVK